MYKLYINNLEWEIKEANSDSEELKLNEENVIGFCQPYTNTIYIDKTLKEYHKKRVLAHELTHAYIYSHLLTRPEKYSEEELCDFVALYGKQIWNQVDEYFFKQEINQTTIQPTNKKKEK